MLLDNKLDAAASCSGDVLLSACGRCAGFEAEGPDSAAAMEHAYKFVLRWGSVLAVVLIIVWPLLALAAGTFSRSYFYFWVILSIIWGLVRAAAGVLPRELVCGSCQDETLSIRY